MRKVLVCTLFFLTLLILAVNPNYKSEIVGANYVTVYSANYSGANSKLVKNNSMLFHYGKVKGESALLDKSWDIDKIKNTYRADIVFVERVQDKVIYYLKYANAKYQTQIDGKVINMQVVVDKDFVKVGVPVIFEGF